MPAQSSSSTRKNVTPMLVEERDSCEDSALRRVEIAEAVDGALGHYVQPARTSRVRKWLSMALLSTRARTKAIHWSADSLSKEPQSVKHAGPRKWDWSFGRGISVHLEKS